MTDLVERMKAKIQADKEKMKEDDKLKEQDIHKEECDNKTEHKIPKEFIDYITPYIFDVNDDNIKEIKAKIWYECSEDEKCPQTDVRLRITKDKDYGEVSVLQLYDDYNFKDFSFGCEKGCIDEAIKAAIVFMWYEYKWDNIRNVIQEEEK